MTSAAEKRERELQAAEQLLMNHEDVAVRDAFRVVSKAASKEIGDLYRRQGDEVAKRSASAIKAANERERQYEEYLSRRAKFSYGEGVGALIYTSITDGKTTKAIESVLSDMTLHYERPEMAFEVARAEAHHGIDELVARWFSGRERRL